LILVVGGITYADLKPLIPKVLEALNIITPGEIVWIERD
jgi:hypothetical protein